jgi:hypothetical protein
MKSVIGFGLIVLAVVSLFRYPNFGRSLPESIGVLIGMALFVVPGILLIRSDNKKSDNKQ